MILKQVSYSLDQLTPGLGQNALGTTGLSKHKFGFGVSDATTLKLQGNSILGWTYTKSLG